MPEFDLELFKEVLTGGVYDESGWRVVGCEPVGEGASWRARVRHGVLRVLERRLNSRGLTLVRRAPLDVAERTRGADWPFIGYTMIGRLRLLRSWGGLMDMSMDGSPIIDRTPIEGLYLNAGWCYGGFKATPASGWCFAHTIARNEPHALNAAFRLDRFATGHLIDEKGVGAQPNLH